MIPHSKLLLLFAFDIVDLIDILLWHSIFLGQYFSDCVDVLALYLDLHGVLLGRGYKVVDGC